MAAGPGKRPWHQDRRTLNDHGIAQCSGLVREVRRLATVDEILARIWENLVGRLDGPMKLRFLLQPTMATMIAIKAGLKDAQESRPAYFWAIFTDASQRRELLHQGWIAVSKVFIIAAVMDVIYQYLVFRWFYPGEALTVAFVLAFIPYLLIRGPVNRIAQRSGNRGRIR